VFLLAPFCSVVARGSIPSEVMASRTRRGNLAAMRAASAGFGPMLRRWRAARRMSQLDLSLQARISSRHVSFLETGRARPSREMVLGLCGALDVPLRDRNGLLLAAGFAPAYGEADLASPAAVEGRWALQLTLRHHEPFAAVAFDRRWNVLMANAPWLRLASLADPAMAEAAANEVLPHPRPNLLNLLFDRTGLRECIENFDEIAGKLLARVERELAGEVDEHDVRREYLAREELAVLRARVEPDARALILPVRLRVSDLRANLFSTIATLGTAQDVTLEELRIEAFYPADAQTERAIRGLAATS
jgi:transcriptional regulator with XRE-family HTH domain